MPYGVAIALGMAALVSFRPRSLIGFNDNK